MKEGAKREEQTETPEPVTKKLTFKIGGFSNQIQAKADAQDFMKETVFEYRSAIFPNPRNFHLRITPLKADVRQWEKPPSPLNTLYINLELDVEGIPDMIGEWERRVLRSIKAFMPESWGDETDRAKHLKETGREDPRTSGVQAPVEGSGITEREQHLKEQNIPPYKKEGAKSTTLEGLD